MESPVAMNEIEIDNAAVSRASLDTSEKTTELEQNGSSNGDQETSIAQAWMDMRSYIRQLHRTTIKISQTNGATSNPPPKSSNEHIKKLAEKLVEHDPQQLFLRVHQLSYEFCIELKVRLLTTCKELPGYQEARRFIQGLCECYQWVMNVCETMQNALQKLDTDHLSMVGLNWITVNMHTFYSTLFTDPDVQEYLTTCVGQVNKVPSAAETLGCLFSLKRTLSVAEGLWTRAVKHLEECSAPRSSLAAHNTIGINWTQSNSSCKADTPEELCTRNSGAANSLESGMQPCPCRECATLTDSGMVLSGSPTDNAPASTSSNEAMNCACHFCDSLPNGHQESEVTSVPQLTQLSLYPHIHGSSEILSAPYMPGQSVSKPPAFNNPYLGTDLLTQQLIREWDMTYGDTLTPPGTLPPIPDVKNSIPVGDESELLPNGMQNLSLGEIPNNGKADPNTFVPINTPAHSLPETLPSSQPVVNQSGVIAHTNSLPQYPGINKGSRKYPSEDQQSSDDQSSDDSSSRPNSSGNEPDTSSDGDISFSYDEDQPEKRHGRDTNREAERMLKLVSKKSRARGRYCRTRECCHHSEKPPVEEEDDGTLADFRRRAPDVTITVVKPGQQRPENRSGLPQVVSVTRSNFKTQRQSPLAFSQPDMNDVALPPPSWVPPPGRMPFSPNIGQLTDMPTPSPRELSPVGKDNSSTEDDKSSLGQILKNLDSATKAVDPDNDPSSRMVTIKRVVDGVSEPTVTITLKGQEPKEDKVLFKLVNGQAPNNENNTRGMLYEIPEGLTPQEARTYKNRLKKQRKKTMKMEEKRHHEEAEIKKRMEIEKQQQFLKDQEKKIRQQQAALKKQQEELVIKKKVIAEAPPPPPAKKGKKNQGKNNDESNKNMNLTHNFNLPPGVSINKVAGQPGVVTISNNMGNSFGQPFLNNPNMMPSFRPGYSVSSAAPASSNGNTSLEFFNNVPGPWSKNAAKPKKSDKDIIYIDTKSPPKRPKSKEDAIKLWFESLTSEEKVERALLGEIDLSMLNKTQTKKYKKQLKVQETEKAVQEEKERLAKLAAASSSKKKNKKQPASNAANKKDVKISAKTEKDTCQQKTNPKSTKSSNVSQNPPVTTLKSQNGKNKKETVTPKIVEEKPQKNGKQSKSKTATQLNEKPKQSTSGTTQSQTSNPKNQSKKDASTKAEETSRKKGKKSEEVAKPIKKNPVVIDKKEPQKTSKKTANDVIPAKVTPKAASNKKVSNTQSVEPTSSKPEVLKPPVQQPKMNGKAKSIKNAEAVAPKPKARASKVSQNPSSAQKASANHHQEYESNHAQKAQSKPKGSFEDSYTIDSVFAPKLNMCGEIVDEAEREVEAFKRFCYDHPRTLGQKPKVDLNVNDIFSKKSLK